MLKIHIDSDRRGEGKTRLAVRLLQAYPEFYLCVRNPHQVRMVTKTFHLAPSQIRRIVTPQTDLSGANIQVMIEDLN